MHFRRIASVVLGAVLLSCLAGTSALAQSNVQRVEVMKSRLETMRRSLNNAISSFNAKGGDDKTSSTDDSLARLRGLEQEVSAVLKDVLDASSKIERSERLDAGLLEKLETSVAELNPRVEAGLQSTAGARNAAASSSGTQPKKKKKKGFLGIFGGGDDDKYAELTGTVAAGRDRVLFEEAAKEVRKSNYDTGRLLFNTIITTYPDSTYLPMAKLAIADSFYLEGLTSSLIQAAAAYQDWLTFFPTHPLADDVMLKIAETDMRQMGLPDRQTTNARKAEQRLKVLLQQFPDTPLREAAIQRLNEVQENLAMHNLQVARFYYGRMVHNNGGLKGAQSRLREIVEKYPNFSYMDEVLMRLGDLYVQEEEPDEAAKFYQQVVRDYPNGEYAEKAKDQLTKIGAAIPDPDPIKKGLPLPERPGRMQKIMTEVLGTVDVTVDKNGVLISKDDKSGNDLIDIVMRNQGELPSSAIPNAPSVVAPVQRRPPARPVQQNTTPATRTVQTTGSGLNTQPRTNPATPTPSVGQPTTTPATTAPTITPPGTKP